MTSEALETKTGVLVGFLLRQHQDQKANWGGMGLLGLYVYIVVYH